MPLLGQVPLEPALREGGDTGVPVIVGDPDPPRRRPSRRSQSASAHGPRSGPERIASPLAVLKG